MKVKTLASGYSLTADILSSFDNLNFPDIKCPLRMNTNFFHVSTLLKKVVTQNHCFSATYKNKGDKRVTNNVG